MRAAGQAGGRILTPHLHDGQAEGNITTLNYITKLLKIYLMDLFGQRLHVKTVGKPPQFGNFCPLVLAASAPLPPTCRRCRAVLAASHLLTSIVLGGHHYYPVTICTQPPSRLPTY